VLRFFNGAILFRGQIFLLIVASFLARLLRQVFVNGSTFLNWDFSKLKEGPERAWTGEYFYLCWLVRAASEGATFLVAVGSSLVETPLLTIMICFFLSRCRRRWLTFSQI